MCFVPLAGNSQFLNIQEAIQMANDPLESLVMQSRLKSERRRKRLQKEGADRYILKRFSEKKRLLKIKYNLGLVPLAKPYQRGWERSFVLRHDVRIGNDGEFFQILLDKINTVEYSHRKDFKKKKRKGGKRIYETRIQKLKEMLDCEFEKYKFTDREKLFFREEWRERALARSICRYRIWIFTEPWRFVLTVKPKMITHTRIIDIELEQQIGELNQFFTTRNLYPRIGHLRGERQNYYNYGYKQVAAKYKFLMDKRLLEEQILEHEVWRNNKKCINRNFN